MLGKSFGERPRDVQRWPITEILLYFKAMENISLDEADELEAAANERKR